MNDMNKLERHISPLALWAFSLGTSIGWGSLVVTSNTYLIQAGPWGSVLGLIIGGFVMLIMGWNYAYLMRGYPDSGGAYTYTREAFGFDQGFLAAWFILITYFAILWANITSIPLFARVFLGDLFKVGKLYTVFGYDVYLGEFFLSVIALILTGLLCMRFKKAVNCIMIALAALFSLGILLCFIAAFLRKDMSMSPVFLTDRSALSQIVQIAVISPWAFIGFESISHGGEEINFEHGKIRKIFMISVVATLVLYICVTLLSVTAYPAGYANWLDYIRDLGNLSGLEALPAFYAADHYLGDFGVVLLMLALLALVLSSLIGNLFALSRLLYSMAKDQLLPKSVTKINRYHLPANAVLCVVVASIFIPLVGRTAIGWIVDVTTIGATLIYGLVSVTTIKIAKEMENRREVWTGRIGLVLMVIFGSFLLIPNIVSTGSMARESYFLFIAWSVFGFLYFRGILRRDTDRKFGSSIIVWVALLSLVLFIGLIWMRQSMLESDSRMLAHIQDYYTTTSSGTKADEAFMIQQIKQHGSDNTTTMIMAFGMFAFAILIMFTNHSYMNKRSNENEMLAIIDSMTGVKNKRAYSLKEQAMNEEILNGSLHEFAVVVCDVNGLKKINDTLGHKAGDEYICNACRIVCEIYKHSPVYRIGGDEFLAVLTGHDYEIRTELMQALHDSALIHIEDGGVVVSGGISEFMPGDDTDFHSVFVRADHRMYEEKKFLKSLGSVTRDD